MAAHELAYEIDARLEADALFFDSRERPPGIDDLEKLWPGLIAEHPVTLRDAFFGVFERAGMSLKRSSTTRPS